MEVDRVAAARCLNELLQRDVASLPPGTPVDDADVLVAGFFEAFADKDSRFYADRVSPSGYGGVLAVGSRVSGGLWVEDKD
jgi:hypothetical protein